MLHKQAALLAPGMEGCRSQSHLWHRGFSVTPLVPGAYGIRLNLQKEPPAENNTVQFKVHERVFTFSMLFFFSVTVAVTVVRSFCFKN